MSMVDAQPTSTPTLAHNSFFPRSFGFLWDRKEENLYIQQNN